MKILILTLAIVLSACDSFVDDQSIATKEQLKIINPAPVDRKFAENNKAHKVILAVLDSGIDYNHPFLTSSIHFELNENQLPVSAGWDFTGNDPWPAPYVARTNNFNLKIKSSTSADSAKMIEAMGLFHQEHSDLAKLFPVDRNLEEEIGEGVYHGTHVAGLATYDSPEIGLKGYRVFPMNLTQETENFSVLKINEAFSKILLSALRKAISDGARVINMSLGMTSDATSTRDEKDFFLDFQYELQYIARSNPQTIFVVAAGNDGKWVDGRSVMTLPCYVPEKNVICVSALTKEMTVAGFSNQLKTDEVTTIYAWGEDIISLIPQSMCLSEDLSFDDILKGVRARERFAKTARQACKGSLFKSESGTSMASPIIARKVAQIIAANPADSSEQIKEKLFAMAGLVNLGGRKAFTLPIEKPSWYSTAPIKNLGQRSRNWHFVIQ